MLITVPTVSSRQHRVVKTFRSVARHDDARALIDGWHLLHDAEAAGLEIETVAVRAPVPDGAAVALLKALHDRTVVVHVTDAVMRALSPVRTPSGVAAIVRRRSPGLGEMLEPSPPLVVVPVDLQDPGNAGAIVRAAEAGGASGVVFAGASADPWGWKSLRAAMGSTFRLPVIREPDPVRIVTALRARGLRLAATAPGDGRPMHEADFRGPTALLLGAEGRGLAAELVAAADVAVSIPMRAPVESLNVAVAAGVLVYEALRQRAASPRPA
jgi:TrmH family RNA methyltransferase